MSQVSRGGDLPGFGSISGRILRSGPEWLQACILDLPEIRPASTGWCIAKEARLSLGFPISRVVLRDFHSGAQRADEAMLGGVDDDADVASPDDEVSGPRIKYAIKTADAFVKFARFRIGVRQPDAIEQLMHKMGAVERGLTYLHRRLHEQMTDGRVASVTYHVRRG